jgi:hypothetical protein
MKRIASVILAVLSVACMQVFAQNTEDWGAFELEAAISHSQGTFSPGFNGRLSVGYIVPSGKAGVYLDWGSGSGNISEAAHTVLVSGGLPSRFSLNTVLRFLEPLRWWRAFSVVPKVGLGMGTAENGNGDRKYYFAAALSATLRYYVSDSFYCGFDARFVGLNSSVGKQDKFMYNPEFGICVGLVL